MALLDSSIALRDSVSLNYVWLYFSLLHSSMALLDSVWYDHLVTREYLSGNCLQSQKFEVNLNWNVVKFYIIFTLHASTPSQLRESYSYIEYVHTSNCSRSVCLCSRGSQAHCHSQGNISQHTGWYPQEMLQTLSMSHCHLKVVKQAVLSSAHKILP